MCYLHAESFLLLGKQDHGKKTWDLWECWLGWRTSFQSPAILLARLEMDQSTFLCNQTRNRAQRLMANPEQVEIKSWRLSRTMRVFGVGHWKLIPQPSQLGKEKNSSGIGKVGKESPPAEPWPRAPDHLPTLSPWPDTAPCSQVFFGNKPHSRQGRLLIPPIPAAASFERGPGAVNGIWPLRQKGLQGIRAKGRNYRRGRELPSGSFVPRIIGRG